MHPGYIRRPFYGVRCVTAAPGVLFCCAIWVPATSVGAFFVLITSHTIQTDPNYPYDFVNIKKRLGIKTEKVFACQKKNSPMALLCFSSLSI
jgi:hypothetical protein